MQWDGTEDTLIEISEWICSETGCNEVDADVDPYLSSAFLKIHLDEIVVEQYGWIIKSPDGSMFSYNDDIESEFEVIEYERIYNGQA